MLEKYGLAGTITLHAIEDEDAQDLGWALKYFDGETEVTDAVTSVDGYPVTLEGNGEHVLRLEITADANAEVDLTQLVSGSADGNEDAVGAKVNADELDLHPDLEIKPDVEASPYIGGNIRGDDGTNQTVTQNVTYDAWTAPHRYLVKVRERDGKAGPIAIKGPVAGTGGLEGWTVNYLDGTTNVTAGVTSSSGYPVTLEAEGEHLLTVEVTASTEVHQDASVPVTGTCRAEKDKVLARQIIPQYIGGLEWSVDNLALDDPAKQWNPAPASGEPAPAVTQGTTISVRAIPGKTPLSDWPWPIGVKAGRPKWTDVTNGVSHFTGPTYTAHFSEATGAGLNTVTAECGNQKSLGIRVRPFYELDLWAEDDVIDAGGQGDLAQTEVTAQVTDSMGKPLAGVTVHFTLLGASGQLNGPGTEDDTATTDADGYATVILKSGNAGDNVQIKAELELPPGTQSSNEPVTTEVGFE